MQIVFRTTSQITASEWESYTLAFNQVFKKEYTIDFFQNKYLLTVDKDSYHVFLKEDNSIVGACSVIPYIYDIERKTIRCGLAVDVFILPEFRTDPMALYRMYKLLKSELILKEIVLVMAIPNDMAYPYWKNVVKWKDVGILNYYALPLKAGNLTGKFKVILNPLSYFYTKMMLFLSQFIVSTERKSKIKINRNNKIIEKQRYTDEHVQLRMGNTFASYRIVNEEGINTCYLIDFYNIRKACKDALSLYKAIETILFTENVDLIVFVGKLKFFQLLLLKVPFRFEPKHLYLMTDILIPEKLNTTLLDEFRNWDFGLFNYDVR